jgi:hypothetical protein
MAEASSSDTAAASPAATELEGSIQVENTPDAEPNVPDTADLTSQQPTVSQTVPGDAEPDAEQDAVAASNCDNIVVVSLFPACFGETLPKGCLPLFMTGLFDLRISWRWF